MIRLVFFGGTSIHFQVPYRAPTSHVRCVVFAKNVVEALNWQNRSGDRKCENGMSIVSQYTHHYQCMTKKNILRKGTHTTWSKQMMRCCCDWMLQIILIFCLHFSCECARSHLFLAVLSTGVNSKIRKKIQLNHQRIRLT